MEYEIKPKEKLNIGFNELWQFKELFYYFTWRDIKIKYKQTLLGFVWAILQPLLMMIIFASFLGNKLYDPGNKLPYPIFIFSGLLLWNIFSSGVTSAGNSMISNASIIKKIYFPRLIIPISSILVSLFDFLMASIVFIGMLIYYHLSFHFFNFIVFFFTGIIITCIASFGLGCMLAALNIKYRDFKYIIPFLVQALLFISPVFYQISTLNGSLVRIISAINPMYAAIELFRRGIFEQELDSTLILISITSSVMLFITGLYYFRKTESYFADLA